MCRGYPQTPKRNHWERNPTVVLKNINKISERLKAVKVLEITDIISKGDVQIGKFSHPYLFVCCKNVNE